MSHAPLSPLDYEQPPAAGTARWATASVAVGVVSMLAAGAGIGVAASSGAPRWVWLALFAVVIVGGPLLGITLGAVGLRRTMRLRWVAVAGILLNLSLWVMSSGLMLVRVSPSTTPATPVPTPAPTVTSAPA